MNPCEFATFVTTVACSIAKGKSADELAILAAFFTQLADTLTTLSLFSPDDDN